MIRTLILYESRYGFTEGIAEKLSLILGPAKSTRTTEFSGNHADYDMVVICTPVYSESVDCKILHFIAKNITWLKQKKIVLICNCLNSSMANLYLEPLLDLLGDSVIFSFALKGQLMISKLDCSDYEAIEQYFKSIGIPIQDIICNDQDRLIEFALKIKELKDDVKRKPEEKDLNRYADQFINCHNTCVIATGHGESVRATPIEYTYLNGSFYLLSEGGIKFANLMENHNVSLSIFNEYTSMRELGGMQITGTAELIDIGSDEYISVLNSKGINSQKLLTHPIAMNMIRISISRIEFLWSEFSGMGYDIKQIIVR